ncbi:MAG: hypothetical protein JRF35_10030 [Deltaproteobacteria bacterium]|nr:hypothetical protein [Deltaproteobacteria bacterium]
MIDLLSSIPQTKVRGSVAIWQIKPGKPFLMMEHDVPKNVFVRMLFYLRLLSMGPHKASRILRHERELLMGYFHSVEKITTPTGRSKIMVCR